MRNLDKKDLPLLQQLTDQLIGPGYYKLSELEEVYQKSLLNGENFSWVLLEDGAIKGFRFSYPPGNWTSGKGEGLTESQWPHAKSDTAYFQSLFISPKLTGQGYGKKISQKALDQLKSTGAKGVVCHSWVESPHDSARRYLKALGCVSVAQHKEYWKDVDYICPCGNQPCLCTAEEMYLDLEKK